MGFFKKHREALLSPALPLLLISAIFLAMALHNFRQAVPATAGRGPACLVIDPGHGGIDGGAIGLDGSKESEINLAIALKLRAMAEFFGCQCVMTREDDSRRTDFPSYSEREDLIHRTELINAVPNAVLISIHQNDFPTSQPSGAQVLYAQGEGSRQLGELTHGNIVRTLQPNNRRVAEPAPRSLYITSHVSCPAILVECGFVSNSGDLDLLKNERYQAALAAVLLDSYIRFTRPETAL